MMNRLGRFRHALGLLVVAAIGVAVGQFMFRSSLERDDETIAVRMTYGYFRPATDEDHVSMIELESRARRHHPEGGIVEFWFEEPEKELPIIEDLLLRNPEFVLLYAMRRSAKFQLGRPWREWAADEEIVWTSRWRKVTVR